MEGILRMSNDFISELKIHSRNNEVLTFIGKSIYINDKVFIFDSLNQNKRIYFKFDLKEYISNLILKDFVVSMLCDKQTSRMTINNIHRKFKDLKKILKYLDDSNTVFHELNVAVLNLFLLNEVKNTKNFIVNFKSAVNYFLNNNSKANFLVPISRFLDNFEYEKKIDESSIGVMDDGFVSSFISLMVKKFESSDELTKMMISLILVQSQIGLRSNEILYLKAQVPQETDIDGCYIINYYSPKNFRRKESFVGETVLNKFAYKYFMFAYNLNNNKYKNNDLYGALGSDRSVKINSFIRKICIEYNKTLGTLNNNERNCGLFFDNANKLCLELKLDTKFKNDDVIFYPTLQRFRNYRFNFLYRNKVPKEVIDKTVTHEFDTHIDEVHYIDSSKNYEDSIYRVYYGTKSKNYFENILSFAKQFKNIKMFNEEFYEIGDTPIIPKKYGCCLLSSEDEVCDCLNDDLIYEKNAIEYNKKHGFIKIANLIDRK